MSYEGLYYPAYTQGMGSRPRLQSVHPFRNVMAAGTNMNAAWSGGGGGGGTGHSGYGAEHPDYDYQSGPPAHVPSGGSYSYHATADTGYGVPPAPHPPQKGHTGSGKKGAGNKGSGGTSAMTALTLLSFFFFVNLLQGCLKDHMDSMNPTVMVMTTNIRRNRFNKMGEMNSREQSSSASSSSIFTSNAANGANLVVQPADMVAAAAASSAVAMDAIKPAINIVSPYSGVSGSVNKPLENHQQHQAGAQQPPPSPPVYQANNPELYQRPHYDAHQPNPYESHQQAVPPSPPPQQPPQYYPQPQQPIIYANYSNHQQPPPLYLSPQVEHESNFHYPHSDYHYPQGPNSAPPQPSYPQTNPQSPYTEAPPPHQLFSTPHNPFYEYQHPPSPSPQVYKGNRDKPQFAPDNLSDSKYSHNHEMSSSQQNPHGPVPWSSHSASVISGPFRRASIVAVSHSPKWVSVPSNVNDHTDFGAEEEETGTVHNNRNRESEYFKKYQ